MNPLELIETGIREGDWGEVCGGYEILTGKTLPIPVVVKAANNAEDILQQISDIIFNSGIGVSLKKTKPTKKKPGRPKGTGNGKGVKKNITKDGDDETIKFETDKITKVQKQIGKTQFITNDPDPQEVKKNKAKAEKSKINKIKLKRNTTKTYKVKCNECENKFDSDRPDGEMGQKCSKCLRDKKGKFS